MGATLPTIMQWFKTTTTNACILARYKSKEGFLLYHWMLMSNHAQLLLGIPEKGSLARVMQSINLAYTLWFNRKYRRVGHL